ncbi:hypothetical protein OEZ86_004437 [Tetradesmus obliquus]|nr:hypothetical protein OEZ86_004437 [Tetradesmus obliquus]
MTWTRTRALSIALLVGLSAASIHLHDVPRSQLQRVAPGYSTADTPGRNAFISPAQTQGTCLSCVGFAMTAAAEAAINVYKQQSWQKLNLSEQDLSFCKLYPRSQWRRGCYCVTDGWCAGIDVLPRGGKLSAAYNGNALKPMAKVKEQIMLTGGVITSMALPWADFERFTGYKQGVFLAMNELQPGTEGVMHAVFCYGWWDDPRSSSDGYWLCKNRSTRRAISVSRFAAAAQPATISGSQWMQPGSIGGCRRPSLQALRQAGSFWQRPYLCAVE